MRVFYILTIKVISCFLTVSPVPSATRLTVSLFHCSSGRKRTRRGWGPLKGSQAVSDQKAGNNEREWYSQTVWIKWPDLSSRHADRTSNQCCICWKARRILKSRAWGKNKAGSFSSFAVSSCDSSSGFRTRRQTSIRYQVQVVTYPFVLSTSFQTWVVLDRDKLACPCLGPWKETTDNFLVYIDSGVIFEEILRLVKGTKNCSIGLTNWHQRNSEETEENSRLWSSKWEFICCPNEYPYVFKKQ